MQVKKIILSVLSVVFILSLVACQSGPTTGEEIYNHLEEAATLEQTFVDVQDSIIKLEKKEKKFFDEISKLDADEMDEIKTLSQDAIKSIEKREEKVTTEQESIHDSRAEFEKIEPLIEEIEDEDARKRANDLFDTMEKRYDEYDNLHGKYVKSMTLEKELYKLLQKDDVKQANVTEKIEQINDSYKAVKKANEKFNESTSSYNDEKKTLYDALNLNVKYAEDTDE